MTDDKQSIEKQRTFSITDCLVHRVFTRYFTQYPRGVLPHMGNVGMCGPKGYGFSAVLVINWVSILAILPPF